MATKTSDQPLQKNPRPNRRGGEATLRLVERLERAHADVIAIAINLSGVADRTPEPFRGAVVQTLGDATYLQGRVKRLLDHAKRSAVV
ncbi:MAG: hypothetical protein M3418_09320 [Gemmatimonadota bacterium]|nr:hypothetical protein [Gemmatimonadota bacterium]